jgi:radical SAM protein with 4Fe4S-binding SPASM domain
MKVSDSSSKTEDHNAHFSKEVENGNFQKLVSFKNDDQGIYINARDVEKIGGCPDLFSRLSIFTSGDVALCSADQSEYFKLGNVINEDPIEVFNSQGFKRYRDKWLSNDYKNLDYCKDCKIYLSRFNKSIPDIYPE